MSQPDGFYWGKHVSNPYHTKPSTHTHTCLAADQHLMLIGRSQKDMLEKIAELDHSQSHLRELNAEMRQWLDAADDDNAVLRLENANLRKQLNEWVHPAA